MSFYHDKTQYPNHPNEPSVYPPRNNHAGDQSSSSRPIEYHQQPQHQQNFKQLPQMAQVQPNPPNSRSSLFSQRPAVPSYPPPNNPNPHNNLYRPRAPHHSTTRFDNDGINQKEDNLHPECDQTPSVYTAAPVESSYDAVVHNPQFQQHQNRSTQFAPTQLHVGNANHSAIKNKPEQYFPLQHLPQNPPVYHPPPSGEIEFRPHKPLNPSVLNPNTSTLTSFCEENQSRPLQPRYQPLTPNNLTNDQNEDKQILTTPFSHQFLTTSTLAAQREYQYRKQLKSLAIHSWYQNDTPTTRQTVFAKSRIAFPVLTSGEPDPNIIVQQQREQLESHPSRMQHPLFNLSPERQRSILFDATPRIISNDITHTTWSKSIQCLLNQSCDCVYTFICTLCYYFKILQVIARNNQKTIIIVSEGKEMRLDSPQAKNLLFTACNILSMKFHDDAYLTNKYFSKLYKMSILALNEIEVLTYRILCWNLTLSDAVIGQVAHSLAECIDPERKQQ